MSEEKRRKKGGAGFRERLGSAGFQPVGAGFQPVRAGAICRQDAGAYRQDAGATDAGATAYRQDAGATAHRQDAGATDAGATGGAIKEFKQTRRRLPHWQYPGSVYFITWRCCGGQRLAPGERAITLEAVRFWDRKRWDVYAAVVMPDHVHVLARPLPAPEGGYMDLGKIIHSVKSFSAQKINRERGLPGVCGRWNVMTGWCGMRRNFWKNGSISGIIR